MKVCRSKCYSISILKSSSGTSTNPCFPLRRAYLFTFMLSHHPLIKSTSWRAHCHLHSLLLTYIGYDLTGSLLPWIRMFSQSLLFKGALHLCFVVSERARQIPLLPYYIMVVLTTCCCLRYLIIALYFFMSLIWVNIIFKSYCRHS